MYKYIFCTSKQELTLGCIMVFLQVKSATLLSLLRSKGYGSMTMVSLGLSTAYHICLKPYAGLVDAALFDLYGFLDVYFYSF